MSHQPWRIEDFPQAELPDQIATLGAGADALVQEGRLAEAETVYRRILDVAPYNLRALTFIAMRAFETGRYEESVDLLQEAIRLEPGRNTLHRNLAFVRLLQGLYGKALESIDQAIALAPDSALNHLHRGVILENLGQGNEALMSYGRALARDPTLRLSLTSLPPRVRTLAARAISRLTPVLQERIAAAEREVSEMHRAPLPPRAREFIEIVKGLRPRVSTEPRQGRAWLFYPGLAARPWFERGEFDWMRDFESAHATIRAEFEALEDAPDLTPLSSNLAARSGPSPEPTGWRRISLYESGIAFPKVLHRCPETFAALKHLPLAQGRGHFPDVRFATLRSGAHAFSPPAPSNVKLTLQLGLLVPDTCSLTVGGETRRWRKGRTLIFDDSFEMSACNESPTDLTVLAAEIWHPALEPIERELIERTIDAQARFSEEYLA